MSGSRIRTLILSYFRHYLNLKILWSVYTEFNLIP